MPRTETWQTVWRWYSPPWCPSPPAVPAPCQDSRFPASTTSRTPPRRWPLTLYPRWDPNTSLIVTSTACAVRTVSSVPMMNSMIQIRRRIDDSSQCLTEPSAHAQYSHERTTRRWATLQFSACGTLFIYSLGKGHRLLSFCGWQKKKMSI